MSDVATEPRPNAQPGGWWSRVKRTLRSKLTWLMVLAVIVVLSVSRNDDDEIARPYDPASSEPDGLKGLVLVLERLDTRVAIGSEVRGDTILLLETSLSDGQEAELSRWVRGGGTLVAVGPPDDLSVAGAGGDGDLQPRRLEPQCDSPYVDGVTSIAPDDLRQYRLLEPRGNVSSCFPARAGSFLAVGRSGLGTVVEVGDGAIFTNQELDRADNSVLVANLVAGTPGSQLTVLQPRLDAEAGPIGGDKSPADFIPEGVKQSFWQMALAGLLLALWRGRRLGKPVEEEHAVALPGSALVVAVGDMLQTSGEVEGAARTLRRDLRRSIGDRLGTADDIDPAVLARLTAQRTRIDERRLLAALVDAPVRDGSGLLTLAQLVEDVHREVAHVR